MSTAATNTRRSAPRIRIVGDPRLGARRGTLLMLEDIARRAKRARTRLVSGLPASPQLTDLENVAGALDEWLAAAGPLFAKIAAAETELRNLVGAESPSAADLDTALDDLERAANAVDAWLDKAGPLREEFRAAVSALRDAVASSGVPQATQAVEMVARYYDLSTITACLREVNRRVRATDR